MFARIRPFLPVALTALMVLATVGAAHDVAAAPDEGRVPNVVGLSLEQAAARLEASGFAFTVEWTPRGRDGHVVAQDPAPGTVLSTREPVRIAVASDEGGRPPDIGPTDPTEVEVPMLRERGFEEAQAALLDLGLLVVPEFVVTRRARPWDVLAQDPEPGRYVPTLTRVVLSVAAPARHDPSVIMPSLFGVHGDRGREALIALGLVPELTAVPSTLPPGNAIAQDPAPGTRLRRGSTVRLAVTTPPRPGQTTPRTDVPRVEGLPLPRAFERLRASGLVWELRARAAGQAPADRVLGQSPPSGRSVEVGSVVRLDVPAVSVVPRLEGHRLARAREIAAQAGLTVVVDGGGLGLAIGHGARVMDQSPPAGARVPAGSLVRVRTGSGGLVAPFTRVPALIGQPLHHAERELEISGLEGRFQGPSLLGHRSAVVTSQFPLPGTSVRRGTTVTVRYETSALPGPGTSVRVPDLRGLRLEAAQRILADRGLRWRIERVGGFGLSGVAAQSPATGTEVPVGTVVRIAYRP